MTEAKRIDHEPKGKPVKSTDPRKPIIVSAFKFATEATMVTALRESSPGTFQAHCLRKGRMWDGEGNYELGMGWRKP